MLTLLCFFGGSGMSIPIGLLKYMIGYFVSVCCMIVPYQHSFLILYKYMVVIWELRSPKVAPRYSCSLANQKLVVSVAMVLLIIYNLNGVWAWKKLYKEILAKSTSVHKHSHTLFTATQNYLPHSSFLQPELVPLLSLWILLLWLPFCCIQWQGGCIMFFCWCSLWPTLLLSGQGALQTTLPHFAPC